MHPSYKFPVLVAVASLLCFIGSSHPGISQIYNGMSAQQVSDQINSAVPKAMTNVTTNAAFSAAVATIPTPASSAPPMELIGGSAGSAPTFRRGDAVQPRITRSSTITLDSSGIGTFDWTTQGALAMPVQPILTPIYAGASAPSCTATSVSGTAVSVKCIFGNPVFLTIGQLTTQGATGMSLNPFASPAAGMSVAIVALPKS